MDHSKRDEVLTSGLGLTTSKVRDKPPSRASLDISAFVDGYLPAKLVNGVSQRIIEEIG
jgi:hypothetical protein